VPTNDKQIPTITNTITALNNSIIRTVYRVRLIKQPSSAIRTCSATVANKSNNTPVTKPMEELKNFSKLE
jgi:hypothetical protein